MKTHNLGYPRIGNKRELKKASEKYWRGEVTLNELRQTAKKVRKSNWKAQKTAGIDLIPSNDFSFYDQVLDTSLTVGAIPKRYEEIKLDKSHNVLDLYFAIARGHQKNGIDITAAEMTKWFDTNYHYIVPEFYKDQKFELFSTKAIDEYMEAKELGLQSKPVLIGPVSYLLLGKTKEKGFDRLDLIENLLPVYIELLRRLEKEGAKWIQLDEPYLGLNIGKQAKQTYKYVYGALQEKFPDLKFIVTTYFEGLRDNLQLAASLPVSALHVDLIHSPDNLDDILSALPQTKSLSLGLVDGSNVWKNDFQNSLRIIEQAIEKIGEERILIAPSCSLLHSPYDLDLETELNPEIKQWLAFAKQKISEVATLKQLALSDDPKEIAKKLKSNQEAVESRKRSELIHNPVVKKRVAQISEADLKRDHPFNIRRQKQRQNLNLPVLPTTTIGSFPQTKEVRQWRRKYRNGKIGQEEYDTFLKEEFKKTIGRQEKVGLDVLVHGEFERNDMVEYFGELLDGFAFTKYGWVQSYGTRCVKPPIIYGDVQRTQPLTVKWTSYAQSLTDRPVKGMLTGPDTIVQWSFVRDDQPLSATSTQVALAIRDEVKALEKAGVKIIQIDEPAFREGLPLREEDWEEYLQWAVNDFRLASSGVDDQTQIHTHMCYAEFNDIINTIADLDADVITLECSRSQMELLDAFAEFDYPNEIGPGVYDIHSPRVPKESEIEALIEKAKEVIPPEQLWVNPDCGLKTRHWKETEKSLVALVNAAKDARRVLKTH